MKSFDTLLHFILPTLITDAASAMDKILKTVDSELAVAGGPYFLGTCACIPPICYTVDGFIIKFLV